MKLRTMIIFLLILCCHIYPEEAQIVSIIDLIANPEKYDQKKIRVIGVARWEFECYALYLSKEAYTYRLSKNAIIINSSPDFKPDRNMHEYDGKYLLIEGYFYKNKMPEGTRSGMYSGKIIFDSIKIWWMEFKQE